VTGAVTEPLDGDVAPGSGGAPGEPLLEVEDLQVEFKTDDGVVRAVDGVSFVVAPGETLAIVGESGSGKSVSALAVMGLINKPGRVAGGEIRYGGRSLREMPEDEYRRLRGGDLAMIFQDPLSSLNPAFRVGNQIAEAIRTHHPDVDKKAARARAAELLGTVGIPQAAERARDYPHQFSGGMRQRAMIAMAIANSPRLLIADEPTTALDVTIQAQVLEVLRAAQTETNAAMVLITHDLGIVAGMADRVLVMYAGRVVEEGSLDEIFYRSRHPYTRGLLAALPRLDADRHEPLRTIAGTPPSLVNLPPGCSLGPRCMYRVPHCTEETPVLVDVPGEPGHRVACFRADEVPELAAGTAGES
jgi:oligopeptide/dipeptide ABC transporter ATP-binding protein